MKVEIKKNNSGLILIKVYKENIIFDDLIDLIKSFETETPWVFEDAGNKINFFNFNDNNIIIESNCTKILNENNLTYLKELF